VTRAECVPQKLKKGMFGRKGAVIRELQIGLGAGTGEGGLGAGVGYNKLVEKGHP
jgi:hypothetical protein